MSDRNRQLISAASDHDQVSGSDSLPIAMSFLIGQGAAAFGYHMALSGPTADFVRDTLAISDALKDFCFSLVCVGAIVGSFAAGWLADKVGRRKALMATLLPFAAGTLLMAFNLSVFGLAVGRLLSGVGVGCVSVLVPMYISETAPTALRGSLGVVNQLSITVGVLVALAIGLLFDNTLQWWRLMNLFALVPSVACFFAAMFGPESPRWLVAQGDQDAARQSLIRLRQLSMQHIEVEMNEIIQSVHGSDGASSAGFSDLCGPVAWRPVAMGVVLMFVQQWSGVNAVLFNINTLTTKAGTVGFAGAQVFCTLVASLVMERQGRRFFLALSAIGMSVSCIVFGYILQQNMSSTLSMICALFYIAFFSFGLGPMPWVVCTELYPARVRTMAVSLSTVVNWTCAFVITLTFSMLSNALGKGGVMYLYGSICLAGAVFVLTIVPETRGLSLDAVEQMFSDHYTALDGDKA